MQNYIHCGDNLPILQQMPSASVDLIYIDPPFNTGKVQGRTQIKSVRSEAGDRTGFGGQRYETIKVGHAPILICSTTTWLFSNRV